MLTKKILIPVIAITVAGTAAFGVASANAQTTAYPLSGLAGAISQKFGIDKTQVQSVVDDYHKKHQEEKRQMMQKRMEEKLTQDVKDGKITEAQKQAIIKKFTEMKSSVKPESFKDMTAEERKKAMENKRTELKSWAESQGIDPNHILQRFGRRK